MGQYLLKNTMTRGEVTPLVHQRRDLELYRQAVAYLNNWYVMKQGGVRRRSGTRYMGASKFADQKSSLISYAFNNEQAYFLEFGNLYMRVWTVDGQVLDTGTPVEIVTPYDADDVEDLQVAPFNDVIYISHRSYAPQKVTRTSNTSWAIAAVEFEDGPYLPINDDSASTLATSGSNTAGASRTFTWSSGVSLTANDIGRHVRFQQNGKWGWAQITAVSSSLIATVTIKEGTSESSSTASWRVGAFYVGNYPGSVAFFEERLVWARTNTHPRSLAFSFSNLPEYYSPSDADSTVTAEHGFFVDIVAGRADPILWLLEDARLQVGTASAIRSIGSSDSNSALAPSNVRQQREVTTGAAGALPVQVGSTTIFAGRTGRRINQLGYDLNEDSQIAPDISILSAHLLKRGMVQVVYQETPDGILWMRDSIGRLRGLTLERAEKVAGYHQHDVGGVVESLAAAPDDDRDVVMMIVQRTIDGSTVRYVERLEPGFDGDLVDQEDAFLVDCGLTYEGSATSTLTGLDHLEGEEVSILSEGAVLPVQTVSGGEITLPGGRTTTKAHVGYAIPNGLKLLPPPTQANDGSTLGRKQRAYQALVAVYETRGLKVGSVGRPLEEIAYRKASTPMGSAPPLLTGVIPVIIEGSWDRTDEAELEFQVPDPLPATILAVNVAVDTEP